MEPRSDRFISNRPVETILHRLHIANADRAPLARRIGPKGNARVMSDRIGCCRCWPG